MKIILIEHCNFIDFPTGGQLNFARNMLSAFGNELLLVGSDDSNTLPIGKWSAKMINDVEYRFFSIDHLRRNGNSKPLIPGRITSFFKLKRYIDSILACEFDYIFVQAPEALFAVPKKYRPKVIFRAPGVANPLFNSRYLYLRPLSYFYDRLFFYFVSSCSLILAAASHEEISEFKERALKVGHVIDVIQFPTRYDESIFFERSKADCRMALGIERNSIIYTTVGRLNWHKGWKLMIDSFSIVSRKIENAKLYFIGEGEDENKIRDYIHQQKLESNVFLCGRLAPPMIALYLNASDAYISASYKEGWSTTLVEACSCNVPCIVTNFSSSYDMIENGINGFVLDSRNDEQFAQSMENAIALDRNNIRKYNRKFSRYAVSKLKDELVNIILNNAR